MAQPLKVQFVAGSAPRSDPRATRHRASVSVVEWSSYLAPSAQVPFGSAQVLDFAADWLTGSAAALRKPVEGLSSLQFAAAAATPARAACLSTTAAELVFGVAVFWVG